MACAIPPGALATSHDDTDGPQAVAVHENVRLVEGWSFREVDAIWGDYSPSGLSASFAVSTWAERLDRTVYANLTNADATSLEALPECADSSKFSTQHVNDTHVPSYVINTTLTCRPKLFGTGVTAGYVVETRYDAPSIDVVVKVNNVNATVRMRSSDPRLGYPAPPTRARRGTIETRRAWRCSWMRETPRWWRLTSRGTAGRARRIGCW